MKKIIKPHDLVTIATPNSKRRRVVECISYPFQMGDDDRVNPKLVDLIKIRWVPGEPCTLGEVAVADLEPSRLGKRAYCHVAEVRGRVSFPEDMLRYDDAALYNHELHEEGDEKDYGGFTERRGIVISEETDEDLTLLADAYREAIPYVRQPRILVYRVTDRKDPMWTSARWTSFGHCIKHLCTRKLGSS